MLEQITSITMLVKKPVELIFNVKFTQEDDDMVAFETAMFLTSLSIFISKFSYIYFATGF